MKILILIPARGGSKRIPQKNIKFLNGKPLIYYAIRNAKSVDNAEAHVVTDDVNIKEVSSVYEIPAIDRPKETATDEATVDDVTVFALDYLETKYDKRYDIVITLQPTSPLLKSASLEKAIDYFISNDFDTLISAREKRSLIWNKSKGRLKPLYDKRVNRQELEPVFEENGAFVICRAEIIRRRKTRIGHNVEIYNLGEEESIDIDTLDHFGLAETILARKNIAFVMIGSRKKGLGHIYRSLTLANKLIPNRSFFFIHSHEKLGIEKLKRLNYVPIEFDKLDNLICSLKEKEIDIVINDVLNTDYHYIRELKSKGFFVVNFEDNGNGATICDLLFNALYEWSGTTERAYYGYKYECLREDIYLYPVKCRIAPKVKHIMIAFGGTDINNATLRILKIVAEMQLPDTQITVILGLGYRYEKELENYISVSKSKDNIVIVKDVFLMSKYINDADLAITANGRMVFEVAALGTPLVVFSQNERESHHIFAEICHGISYLGILDKADDNDLVKALEIIIQNYSSRKKMNEEITPFAKDIRKGINRVISIIFNAYHEWETDGHHKAV